MKRFEGGGESSFVTHSLTPSLGAGDQTALSILSNVEGDEGDEMVVMG